MPTFNGRQATGRPAVYQRPVAQPVMQPVMQPVVAAPIVPVVHPAHATPAPMNARATLARLGLTCVQWKGLTAADKAARVPDARARAHVDAYCDIQTHVAPAGAPKLQASTPTLFYPNPYGKAPNVQRGPVTRKFPKGYRY
jgi:hypothetical protein